MQNRDFPFAVRLIGFPDEEAMAFDIAFSTGWGKGYAYLRLDEGNLQDPVLFIANADHPRALRVLADLRPSALRPALVVGSASTDVPYPRVERPIRWAGLFALLDQLIEQRADALSRLEASDVVIVPERRSRDRLEAEVADPAEYLKMRRQVPADGMVLVVDKNPAFRDHLADILGRYNVPVAWAGDEAKAVALCQQQSTAMMLVNTSTPSVDPYRLCWAVKDKDSSVRTCVVLLTSKPFVYDVQQARQVGVDGYLNKPIASNQLMSVLKRFLPLSRETGRA